MTSDAQIILDHLVSREKVNVGRGYPIPALIGNAQEWISGDPNDALNELFEEGCLERASDRFVLSQVGYDLVCEDKTVNGTKQRIVNHIYNSTAADPKRMNRGQLESFRQALPGCRSNHFDEALSELVRDGIIEMNSLGTATLTGKFLKE